MEVIFISLGMVLVFVIWMVRKTKSNNSRSKKQLKELQDSGFKIDHSLFGIAAKPAFDSTNQNMEGVGLRVVFDDAEKKVAFIFVDAVLLYSYADIKKWEWNWIDKNGSKLENRISFMLRDKERPLIQITGLPQNEAELWMAKLDAILND